MHRDGGARLPKQISNSFTHGYGLIVHEQLTLSGGLGGTGGVSVFRVDGRRVAGPN